jgi:hypothetical protein
MNLRSSSKFIPYYQWQPEWNKEQVLWLTDFLINKIVAPLYCLEMLSKCNGIDKNMINMCIENLKDIERFIREIELKYGH